ncbi:MAG TPA: DUF5679 domain-containing protein [Herpetosiphonaceae bacterium]|nr:DUF5679 domain-containing protein [Herpetosiphonaceae bacterium]
MKKNHRRRWLIGLLTSVAALVVVIRRRLQPIDSRPLLPTPPPPPSEPPRIVLPTEVLNAADSVPESLAPTPPPVQESEAEEVAAAQAEAEAEDAETTAPDNEAEAPLLEREVGGSAAIPAIPVNVAPEKLSGPTPEAAPVLEDEADDDADPMMSYCVSCRTKRPMINTHEETTENGRRALRGTCEVCGSNMFRFLPNEDK